MDKRIVTGSLFIGLFLSSASHAQCSTGIGSTQGSRDTTSTTMCPSFPSTPGTGIPPNTGGGIWGQQPGRAEGEAKNNENKNKQLKELCDNKELMIADAKTKANTCEVDQTRIYRTAIMSCSQIEKAVIQIETSNGISLGVEATLKKFGINLGATTGIVVGGTLEYSPKKNCEIDHEIQRDTEILACKKTAENTEINLNAVCKYYQGK